MSSKCLQPLECSGEPHEAAVDGAQLAADCAPPSAVDGLRVVPAFVPSLTSGAESSVV